MLKKIIIFGFLIILIIGFWSYSYVIKSSQLFSQLTEYNGLGISNFLSLENKQVSKHQYWKRIFFKFSADQTNKIISLYEPISQCEVRGFPLITPLFKDKITHSEFENFNYYWRFIPKGRKSNNAQHILIALHKTNEYGWLLKSGSIYHDEPVTRDYLIKWQNDPFWKKQGCNFKFLLKE